MEQRSFHLRSRATHQGDANELVALALELERDGAWIPVEIANTMPPFRAFVCAALMCQHAHVRMGAAERKLVVRGATGELWMRTEDWVVLDVTSHFKLELEVGSASDEDLAFIAERVRDCPISRNLGGATKATTLEVVTAR